MKLHINTFIILINHLEGMGPIAIHVPVAIGDASVTEQEGHLMSALRPQG